MSDDLKGSRREFLQAGLAAGATLSLAQGLLARQKDSPAGLPTRPLGETGVDVPILCLGGWHIGKGAQEDGEQAAIALMHEAIDQGIAFFDNAWDYHDGYAEELMGRALAQGGYRDRVFLMTKNCGRDYVGARACLEDSLRRLQTDRLDLWQFHEINYEADPDRVFETGGARAALEALEAGKVRFVGFTGHKHPNMLNAMLDREFPWASVQLPINVCDHHYVSFVHQVVPRCLERGIGVLGMKSFGGSPDGQNGILPQQGIANAEQCRRYALSQPIASLVVGIRNRRDLLQELEIGRGFQPMPEDELNALLASTEAAAAEGRFEMFKSTRDFDGPYHKKQHGIPVG